MLKSNKYFYPIMESAMLKMVKAKNPSGEYPSALGQKWTIEEEEQLLSELTQNLDIENIAKNHSRTIGGIRARINEIIYKMHTNKISTDEIISKTNLTEEEILCIVQTDGKYRKIKQTNPNDEIVGEAELIEEQHSKLKRGKKNKYSETKQTDTKNEILEIKERLKNIDEKIEKILKLLEHV